MTTDQTARALAESWRAPPIAAPSPAPSPRPSATCPRCGKPLDRGRCWRCHYRACSSCGGDTASAFLDLCLVCDLGGEPQ